MKDLYAYTGWGVKVRNSWTNFKTKVGESLNDRLVVAYTERWVKQAESGGWGAWELVCTGKGLNIDFPGQVKQNYSEIVFVLKRDPTKTFLVRSSKTIQAMKNEGLKLS